MGSTFMGLETSKRGLSAQQSGLYTTGHNISNANTIGYSRQTVNLKPTNGFPGAGMNAPQIPGYLGTGATAGSIQRVRDQFVDNQFRQETTKLGYWGSRTEAIGQLEGILNEPKAYGIDTAFNDFFKALQDLSTSPENSAARQVAIEKAKTLAESFNYTNKQLTEVQENLKNQINVETKNVNSILKQIAQLNEQISTVEINGSLPNDLYDERDILVDQLSQYLPIKIEKVGSGGNAKDIAEGSYKITMDVGGTTISLVDKNKAAVLTPQTVDPTTGAVSDFDASTDFTAFHQFKVKDATGADQVMDVNSMVQGTGILKSLTESYGYVTKDAAGNFSQPTGVIQDKIAELDKLADEFAKAFNEVHKKGHTSVKVPELDVNGNPVKDANGDFNMDYATGIEFFKGQGAAGMKVSDEILKDFNRFTVSDTEGEVGNGKIAIALSNLKTQSLLGLNNASAQTFYQGMIGDVGVLGEQATRIFKNSSTLQLSISNNRASVSSVSLDEEMTNMIMYQQAYNASARMLTVMDETLEKIINGMGRVGL
ncbi:flagellar hook-associated protein FlgK [Kurthia sp. YJT4]|uniref:flagellar hook-associated protein FlgK n=1 Tax=Kurthia sp. YJT4 TaxID=3049086 RepID=UPI00254E5385|nr:flagellar hook-associated protein FlgK [Kurthia sp. YJT4]WIL39128.1 flagellar hook-associated protein FlgK [Kurthia sp. YJT4]